MRLIVQRVKSAKVTVKKSGSLSGEINNGYLVLLGIKKGDSQNDVDYLVEKLSKLRIMSDENAKMNLSIIDAKGEILLVSQFTLYADTQGGNRPSFIDAEEPRKAEVLYDLFIEKLRQKNITVATGSFGDYMEIEAVLDGPSTILYLEK